MRFFAIYWINKKNGPSEFMGLNVDTKVSLRRQFENVAMTSYFMEKHSKDILTQEEKKDLFKFTDFEQYIVCASHLGAKLAHEECDTDDAFIKLQNIAKKIPEYEEKDKEGNPRVVTSSDPICKKYFDEKQRKNWRNYAKKVMDKTMTSKCDKKAGRQERVVRQRRRLVKGSVRTKVVPKHLRPDTGTRVCLSYKCSVGDTH